MTCGLTHWQRHARLIAEYGRPRAATADEARRACAALGVDHDRTRTVAFAYPGMPAYDAYTRSNAAHGGPPSHGAATVGGVVIGVLDLRGWPDQ